jgi:streptogramin lyase
MSTKRRRRSALAALFMAAIALLLALPALASAEPVGQLTSYKSGLRPFGAFRQVVIGPEGNAWFLDNKSEEAAIGKITPEGKITEYVYAEEEVEETETIKWLKGLNPSSQLAGIAVGPEGKIWFTDLDEEVTPAIGVLDPAEPKEAKEFSIAAKGGNAESVPEGIVAGPDGNLWFGDASEAEPAIGTIDPTTHEVEEFSEGLQAQSLPRWIVAGSDGNLWFTDDDVVITEKPAIGKIDPTTHTIAEFGTGKSSQPGGTGGLNPLGSSGIAAGPDGNVWYTEGKEGARAVCRITPAGKITCYSLPETSKPGGITAGPDGNLWFTDSRGTSEKQTITFTGTWATGNKFELCNEAKSGCKEVTYNTSTGTLASNIKTALQAIYSGTVNVSCGGAPATCKAAFAGELAATNMGQTSCTSLIEAGSCSTGTETQGVSQAIGRVVGKGNHKGQITEYSVSGFAEVTAIAAPSAGGYLWFLGGGRLNKFGIELEPPVKVGPPLTLKVEEGEGTVVSNPAGLECSDEAPNSCTTEEIETGKVVLTASPAPGYLLKGWKGCDTGGVNGRQCTVTLAEPGKTVGVKFYKVFSLEGSKTGGLGIMSTSPGGINCGYACSSSTALYKEGSLTVKAKPAKHFEFVEFTGGTGSATGCNGVEALECTIATFNSNSAIEEVYAEEAKNTLTYKAEGGGQGFVKTTPTNINCGYTCTAAEAQFYASESAAVTVTLNKGTTSVTWVKGAGTCEGKVLSCSVPMSASHELVAKFD